MPAASKFTPIWDLTGEKVMDFPAMTIETFGGKLGYAWLILYLPNQAMRRSMELNQFQHFCTVAGYLQGLQTSLTDGDKSLKDQVLTFYSQLSRNASRTAAFVNPFEIHQEERRLILAYKSYFCRDEGNTTSTLAGIHLHSALTILAMSGIFLLASRAVLLIKHAIVNVGY